MTVSWHFVFAAKSAISHRGSHAASSAKEVSKGESFTLGLWRWCVTWIRYICCSNNLSLYHSCFKTSVHAKQDNVNLTHILLIPCLPIMRCFAFLFAMFRVVGPCSAMLYQGLIGSPTRKARRCLQSWTASLSRGGCTRRGLEKQQRITKHTIRQRLPVWCSW